MLEWGAISFSRGPYYPGIEPRSPALQADALPSEPPVKPLNYLILEMEGIKCCLIELEKEMGVVIKGQHGESL